MLVTLYSCLKNLIIKCALYLFQCIALNAQWSKAHVRLASAYIALGGHSNDACQSLQRAISLDRTNKVAREMLIKEMRARESNERNNEIGSSSNNNNNDSDGGNATNNNQSDETSLHRQRGAQQSSSRNSTGNNATYGINDVDDIDPPNSYESQTMSDRIQSHFTKLISWYQNQSDDIQTLLKVLVAFLILYIALGGRFGLEYVGNRKSSRGNYGHDNAYERYNSRSTNSAARSNDRYGYVGESSSSSGQNQDGNANRAQRKTQSGYNDRTNPQNNQYYSRYSQYDEEEYFEPRQTRSSRKITTHLIPNLFDGSFTSMIILFIIMFICHRFGVNPFHVFWLLQAMQRGGHHRMGGWGYGGFGGGGFGRRRMGRPRW